MRYFVPVLQESSANQTEWQDKFGGLPWGLPVEQWPKCKQCGGYQTMLLQLAHDDQRLSLGRKGRVLFVFQCCHDPGMCDDWEANSGGNACLIIEPEELTACLTENPHEQTEIHSEAIVVDWSVKEDNVLEANFDQYFDGGIHADIPSTVNEAVDSSTHFGSVPYWVQSPSEAPRKPFRFVGQLDGDYGFGSGFNFGDGGLGYIFVSTVNPAKAEGLFFWQCY